MIYIFGILIYFSIIMYALVFETKEIASIRDLKFLNWGKLLFESFAWPFFLLRAFYFLFKKFGK